MTEEEKQFEAKLIAAARESDVPVCHRCTLPMAKNPHPDAGKLPTLLEVGTPYECIPCLTSNRHRWSLRACKAEGEVEELAAALRREKEARDEAERKGYQLCQAVYLMMMACRRLESLQKSHRRILFGKEVACDCDACDIPLPDLSEEAVGKLCDESSAEWAKRQG